MNWTEHPAYLTPTLWVTTSQLYCTNSGVWVSAGCAGLVDPAILPDGIAVIARFLERERLTPRWIVLTHSHWDHILGPEHFVGVPVIAQAAYLHEVERDGEQIRCNIADCEAQYGVERTAPFVIPLPDETLVDETTLSLGDLQLRLIHAPGHAADQIVVYEPQSATLWAADMLSDIEIPLVSHNLAAYERTLARLAALDVRILVPGHGHPTGEPAEIRSRLSTDIAYLAELRSRVAQAVQAGRSIDETVARCASMDFRCREDNAASHRLNVESAYAELGGAANASEVGWKSW